MYICIYIEIIIICRVRIKYFCLMDIMESIYNKLRARVDAAGEYIFYFSTNLECKP